MIRAAKIIFVLLAFAIGAPIAVYYGAIYGFIAVGATVEHFAGQDGDE